MSKIARKRTAGRQKSTTGARKNAAKTAPAIGDSWREHLESSATPEQLAEIHAQAEFMWSLICARKEAGLSQQAISAKTGVSQKALSRMETGDANARLDTLLKFAAATGKRLALVPA